MFFICLLMAAATGATAQIKVMEKSSKKTPDWLNTAVEDHLVVSVVARSLAEAQERAHTEITERIIQAVASNITVSTSNVMSEVNINGNIESEDNFRRVTKMKSANIPFLKGISLSNAKGVYWRKVQDKKTRDEHYEYSVLYPFSRMEQRKLIARFEELDAEMNSRYEALESGIGSITSVVAIKDGVAQAEMLADYFFDDVRLNKAKAMRKRYMQLYDALTVAGNFVGKGRYRCSLMLDGRPVATSVPPKVTSNCAGQIAVTPDNGAFIITYDGADCLPDEENFIDIRFNVSHKRLEHKAYISETEGAGAATMRVVPEGKLVLAANRVEAQGRTVADIDIRMTLNNIGGTPFGLKAIELHIPELSSPLIFDDIDLVYTAKGIIQVKVRAEGTFKVRAAKGSPAVAQGSLVIANPDTSATERRQLSLPYVTNW